MLRRHLAFITAAVTLFAVAPPALAVGLTSVGAPLNVLPPSIAGSAQQGQTLACSPGTWLPTATGYAYAWQRTGSAISGASASSYTVTSADVNQAITCSVVASNASGSSLTATSLPVVPVGLSLPLAPVSASPPVISGTAEQGQTLACSNGTWSNSPTGYAYSWLRDGSAIAGATSSTYTASASDVSQLISCAVVASNAVGQSVPAVSLPVVPTVPPSGTGGGGGSTGGGSAGGSSTGGGSGASSSPSGSHTGAGAAKPRVLSFSVSPHRMVITVKGRRKTTKGATFSYRLDRAATLYIVIERRVGKRWVMVTKLTVRVKKAGSGKVRFNGRARRSLVSTGNFKAVVAAANAAGWSSSRTTSFAVVRKLIATRAHR